MTTVNTPSRALPPRPDEPRVRPRRKRRSSRLRAVGQLMSLFAGSGRWWLIPLVVILGLATVILIGVKIAQYAAPFVYTLF